MGHLVQSVDLKELSASSKGVRASYPSWLKHNHG